MNEEQQREHDQDPAPVKHSDAERATAEQAAKVPASGDAEGDGDEAPPEAR